MKKLILGLFLCLFLVQFVSATSSSINIDDIGYKPSKIYPSTLYATGSQIITNLTITNIEGWNYIKRTWLSWNDSAEYPDQTVGCTNKNRYGNIKEYQCTLTISPFMNGIHSVYAYSLSYDGSISKKFVGSYNFQGQQFPQPSQPTRTWNSNRHSFREKQRNGEVYFGENREYSYARVYLSTKTNSRRDYASGSVRLRFNSKERLDVRLSRIQPNIIEWTEDLIIVEQMAKVTYRDYSNRYNRIRKKEEVNLRYTIYPKQDKVEVEFEFDGEDFTLIVGN